jgi:hypothetical protein
MASMNQPHSDPVTLDYANEAELMLPQIQASEEGSLTITIPTRRTAWQFICGLGSRELLAFSLVLLLAPILWIVFKALATRRPRAVIVLTSKHLSIDESQDNSLGVSASHRAWPLDQIGECRKNRYANGLYVTIKGRDSFTLFPDLPEKSISIISDAIGEARKKLASS